MVWYGHCPHLGAAGPDPHQVTLERYGIRNIKLFISCSGTSRKQGQEHLEFSGTSSLGSIPAKRGTGKRFSLQVDTNKGSTFFVFPCFKVPSKACLKTLRRRIGIGLSSSSNRGRSWDSRHRSSPTPLHSDQLRRPLRGQGLRGQRPLLILSLSQESRLQPLTARLQVPAFEEPSCAAQRYF